VDEELRELLGSVRSKTFALLFMLFAAALFVEEHVKHDLAQETEIRQLLEYISHLEKQTTIYCQRINELKENKYICLPP